MKIFLLVFFINLYTHAAQKSGWKYGIGLGYSPIYIVTLSGSGTSSGTPYTASYDLIYAGTPSIQFDIRNLSKDSWGFVGGFEYEGEREITSGTYNGISFSINSNSKSKYQSNFLHLAVAYRWDIFYLPFGLSYAWTNFTKAPQASGTASSGNGSGLYFGFGWNVGDSFAIEYISRSATTTLSIKSGSDSENTSGVLAASALSLKYFFN